MEVLIVDDDPISLRLLEKHLAKWDYEVTAVGGGEEAWDLFQRSRFPIVVSDWMMPGLDGLEFVRRIRSNQRWVYVFVILLTAKTQKGDLVRGMEAGADDFVTKPVDWEELRARLRAGERLVGLEHSLAQQNQTLLETQAALLQSEKLAGLGQLAAGVAHEVNNPIAYLTTNIAVLRRDVQAVLAVLDKYQEGDPQLQQTAPELLAQIQNLQREADLDFFRENFLRLCDQTDEGLKRVRTIVSNLRDFARLDEADEKEIDLNEALLSVVEVLRHQMNQSNLRVEQDLQELPPFACRPKKLNQVFLNLIGNAVDASKPEGVLTLRTRLEGDWIVLEVTDRGSGISEEDLPHIFEPFFTTKQVGSGTGLGLSVSYGVIRDHGGVIEVESKLGEGSTFRIRLPRTGPPSSEGE